MLASINSKKDNIFHLLKRKVNTSCIDIYHNTILHHLGMKLYLDIINQLDINNINNNENNIGMTYIDYIHYYTKRNKLEFDSKYIINYYDKC